MQRTYGVSANLIQLWLTQFDRGELHDEESEASVIAEYEAHIAAIERKAGHLTMELDLMKKTPRQAIAGDSGSSSIITGPRPALSTGPRKVDVQLFRNSWYWLSRQQRSSRPMIK